MSYSFAGILFGLFSLILGYAEFSYQLKNPGTLALAASFAFLGLGVLLLVVSGVYLRRRAKRLGILDAMGPKK
jgi:hypothetical protein